MMHASALPCHTYSASTRWKDGSKSSTERQRALRLDEGNETNEKIEETNGERDKTRTRGRGTESAQVLA